MSEKNLGADAAAVESAEPVASEAASRAAHTPGPWDWYGTKALEAKGETVLVADCGLASCGRAHIFVSGANAHLIAAAPELLEVCKHVINAILLRDIDMELVRAAISKAEGRS